MKLSLKKSTLKVLSSSVPIMSGAVERKIYPVLMTVQDACGTQTCPGQTGCTGTECGITYVAECGTGTLYGTCRDCTNTCPGPDGDCDTN